MRQSYRTALAFALQWEKWRSDVKGDSGGHTIWGVSTRWFPEDVKKMENMTQEESRAYVVDFYLREFWIRAGCDALPYPNDWLAFDCAVNQGVALARSLSKRHTDYRDFLLARIKAYVDLPGQVLEGWPNRCFDLWQKIKEGG